MAPLRCRLAPLRLPPLFALWLLASAASAGDGGPASVPSAGAAPAGLGDFVESRSGLVFVRLPGGLLAGGTHAGREVKPFSLGKTEVTLAAYTRCVAAGACTEPGQETHCTWKTDLQDHPINCLEWEQARAFCAWAGGRLPTSEEWEWAASGGEARTYPWGNEEPTTQSCWKGNRARAAGRSATCRVGAHPEGNSKHGLQDLAGNVWEWTATDYGTGKEIRGGGFSFGVSLFQRAAYRSSFPATYRFNYLGVRCAR